MLLQAGYSEQDILHLGEPAELPSGLPAPFCDSQLMMDAMTFNDDWEMNTNKREQEISELFKEQGYEVKFKGEVRPTFVGY